MKVKVEFFGWESLLRRKGFEDDCQASFYQSPSELGQEMCSHLSGVKSHLLIPIIPCILGLSYVLTGRMKTFWGFAVENEKVLEKGLRADQRATLGSGGEWKRPFVLLVTTSSAAFAEKLSNKRFPEGHKQAFE